MPFPVQDWAALDSTDPPTDLTTDPDPGPPAAPPSAPRRRPAPLPLLVITIVLVLLAGSIFVAERVVTAPGGTHPFVPADGVGFSAIRERPGRDVPERIEVESVVLSATAMLGGIDYAAGPALLGALADDEGAHRDLDRIRLWRTISTAAGRQTTTVHRVDGDIDLVLEDRESGDGWAYRPGLTELPAGAGPWATWRDRGSAGRDRSGAEVSYESDFRAEPAAGHPPDCLQTTGRITYRDSAGHELGVRRLQRVWCPGRGPVQWTDSGETVREAAPPAVDPSLADESAWGWSGVAGWQPRQQDPVSRSPGYGEAPVAGVPGTVPPVITGGGLIARPSQTGQDLVLFETEPGGPPRTKLRLHPGGSIGTLTAFGRVLVVTTSLRRVVAYSDDGVRLWQHPLDEVVQAPPVRVDGDGIVLAQIDGTVFGLDLLTGRRRWQSTAGARVFGSPAAGGGVVVFGGSDGTLTALSAGDGGTRWSVDSLVGSPRLIGATVITVGDNVIEARDLVDGRTRWRLVHPGTLISTAEVGGRLVVVTRLTTMIIDESGAVMRRLPPLAGALGHGELWAGWTTDRIMIMDGDGAELAGWPMPPETWGTGTRVALATPAGVQLYGLGWGWSEWAH